MTFFYIFVIEYTLRGHDIRSSIILENAEQCQLAIRGNEQLSTEIDANLYCIKTGRLSKSIRPKLRPAD